MLASNSGFDQLIKILKVQFNYLSRNSVAFLYFLSFDWEACVCTASEHTNINICCVSNMARIYRSDYLKPSLQEQL